MALSSSFATFILENQILGFFPEPVTLKSGRSSHYYVNWRRATNDAFLLDRLSDFLIEFMQFYTPDCMSLYGVPEGASKTAIVTSLKWARASQHYAPGSHVICMGRAQPKAHGEPKDRYFIGEPRGPTYILEDTITSGMSLFGCIDQLLLARVDVRGVIALTDRCELLSDGSSVAATLVRRYGPRMQYHVMSRAPDLLPFAIRQEKPSPAIIRALAQELGQSYEQLLAYQHREA